MFQVVKAYESGVRAIQQITGDLTVDKVEKVLDDLQQVRLKPSKHDASVLDWLGSIGQKWAL